MYQQESAVKKSLKSSSRHPIKTQEGSFFVFDKVRYIGTFYLLQHLLQHLLQ